MGFRQRNKKKKMSKEKREEYDQKQKKIKQEKDEQYFQRQQQQQQQGYKLVDFQYRNVLLEGYYKTVLAQYGVHADEFDSFLKICKQRLAVTFRVNKSVNNYKNLWDMIEIFRKENDEDIKRIEWFGNGLIYQLNQNRQQLKKEKETCVLRDLIIQANDSGLISRQELVSMLSPLCLDIQDDDLVLDMCAAPGSKTGQLLESIGLNGKGGVVANDADLQRSNMLIHQIQRNCNSSGILITNHLGQSIPGHQQMYDKVLCDVPCSGDGAIRKIPNKWRFWSYKDGCGLHGLQVQILMRGLQVLKKGGLLLYSTCSLSPIEDEAVVTEIFRRIESKSDLELVDIHGYFKGFKSRKGLTKWPVMRQKTSYSKKRQQQDQKESEDKVDQLIDQMYDTFYSQEEYKQFRSKNTGEETNLGIIKDSMFSENEEFMNNVVGIQKTMRVLPHDQNTGGFYLALFRKKGDIKFNSLRQKQDYEQDVEEDYKNNQTIVKNQSNIESDMKQKREQKQKQKENKEQKVSAPWTEVEDSIWKWIKEYYGFNDDQIKTRLYQEQEGQKRIVLVSHQIKALLNMDFRKNLNIINMGSKAFYLNRENYSQNNCPYRICQDSIFQLYPHFQNRKIKITMQTLRKILDTNCTTFSYQQIDEMQPQFSHELQKYKNGIVVLYLQDADQTDVNQYSDIMVVQNFSNSVCLMISKEAYQGMRIRYCCEKVADYQKVEIKTIMKTVKQDQQ